MINTNFSSCSIQTAPQGAKAASEDCGSCGCCAKCGPQDRVTLGEDRPYIPTAVKLYDMSPIWGPKQGEFRIPMGVHGLC